MTFIHGNPREIKQTIDFDAPAPLADDDIDDVEGDGDAEPEMIQREVEFQEALFPSSSSSKATEVRTVD